MGGRFGEMSTLMNYTFQSFNFRNRQGARPFYDLIANIAAEEFGHIELVAATINTMLTGASGDGGNGGGAAGRAWGRRQRRPAGGAVGGRQGRALPLPLLGGRQGRAAGGFAWRAVERHLR